LTFHTAAVVGLFTFTAGGVFVTIVAYGRELLFGQVIDGEIWLSKFGEIAHDEWLASADIRREIQLDEFAVMPNHSMALCGSSPTMTL